MASLIVHLVGAAQMDQAVWRRYARILLTRNGSLKIKAVNLAVARLFRLQELRRRRFHPQNNTFFYSHLQRRALKRVCVCAFKIPQREMHVFGKVGHK